MEYFDEGLLEPRGSPLSTTVYFNSGHAHYQVTHRSISGVMCFFGSTPVIWYSKRQGCIETSSLSVWLFSSQVATEEMISLRYMLRSLGVPIKVTIALCGNN